MDWTAIAVSTTTDGIEPVTGALLMCGVNGVEIEDKEDFKEFLAGNVARWDYVDEPLMARAEAPTRVKFYLPKNAHGQEMLSLIRGALEKMKERDGADSFGPLTLSFDSIREEDWENGWKQYFKAFAVGERLWITPSWEKEAAPAGRSVLTIDPGSSFGTGQHHTTKLCLAALERAVAPGCRMLDLGCGSGILSAAALILGAKEAVGVDIDENAVRVARENVAENGFSDPVFTAFAGDITTDGRLRDRLKAHPFQVVAANIVSDVLIALAPYFGEFLAQDGILLVSGIIEERADEVLDALKARGFWEIRRDLSGGWAAATLKR